ncbi:RING-H2 finger protein ATL64-like [Lotus japonicus]|uniref:RING-H2 finger protein ATL64-like n=1 Tax=Lotus japonicus TaxID=34305 RepID=UPI0025899226|nr:RING-H2 finger protein ATL64-like [Lotus japonicus]
MSFYNIEDSISGFTIGQAIYEAALLIAVLRWVLCLAFRVMKSRTQSLNAPPEPSSSSSSWESSSFNPLPLTTFGEIMERLPETEDTCAVCLNQLKIEDEVRELMNCYHVFHKECIDRWLEHDHESENHNATCPLCRAPLLSSCCLSSESSSCVPPPQPSWAVERLLYLFGDDLLPC